MTIQNPKLNNFKINPMGIPKFYLPSRDLAKPDILIFTF